METKQTSLENSQPEPKDTGELNTSFRSLRELLEKASHKAFTTGYDHMGDSGIADSLPFPFLAIVGQYEMKLALLLSLINPNVSGILLIGPRGTGKTTAVRSLTNMLPMVERSTCFYGCLPEDIETGGIDAVCPECAAKYGRGESLTAPDRVRLVELPINSQIEDVVGGLDERNASHERHRLKRGILAQSDRNLLYIDEINLLGDDIVDAILDAAAQGTYTVRRGSISSTYRARFVLIGSMNPEEGRLRPQILDRFGLRVIVRGLDTPAERLEAYRRVQAYIQNPRILIQQFMPEITAASAEIQEARKLLKQVTIPDKVAKKGIKLVQDMKIDSLRAEITWFEAARAYAAADARATVTESDLLIIAPMALRLRRSDFMNNYFDNQSGEETELLNKLKTFSKSKK